MSNLPDKDLDFKSAIEFCTAKINDYQPLKFSSDGVVRAAVMILFINKNDIPHLIFTQRTELVEHHKGQVSFPGGAKDASDSSLLQTALRETEEEIGVNSRQIELIGEADDFVTVTNFLVTPFVGILHPPFKFRLSEDEVEEVLQVPLSLFLEDTRFEVKKWNYRGKKYDVYFYYHNKHVIWGATAFILNRFIDLVFGYNPAPNPVYEDPRHNNYLKENKFRGGRR